MSVFRKYHYYKVDMKNKKASLVLINIFVPSCKGIIGWNTSILVEWDVCLVMPVSWVLNYSLTVNFENTWRVIIIGSNIMLDTKYRVSTKTVYTFVFWISRLPRGVEIPSWTFFNSPFRVDSENIQFFIIPWNLDQDIGKILQGEHFKS